MGSKAWCTKAGWHVRRRCSTVTVVSECITKGTKTKEQRDTTNPSCVLAYNIAFFERVYK